MIQTYPRHSPSSLNMFAGMKIGRLTLIEKIKIPGRHGALWRSSCECGNISNADPYRLKSGRQTSCGCWGKEKNTTRFITHGKRNTPAYKSWAGMKQRTTNPKNPDWNYYGGRGITLCERWQSFENFLADMGEPDEGLTIDRIDCDGNYEPNNCRWASRKEQRLNQRLRK